MMQSKPILTSAPDLVSPVAIDARRRDGRAAMPNRPSFAGGLVVPAVRPPPCKIATRCPVHSRARQRRFALPPVVPSSPAARHRAIELLGHATQRKAGLTKPELSELLGALPADRVTAQMWKAGLRRLARNAEMGTAPVDSPVSRLRAKVALPQRDRDIGRVFSALDVARRALAAGRPLPDETASELARKAGVAPTSETDVHHVSRALVHLQRARRSSERRPPLIPKELAGLREANMLLGNFVWFGKVGAKSDRLAELVGGLPRTRNVARSWKKIVEAATRRFLRKERVAARRREADLKRERRRLKKALRGTAGEYPGHARLEWAGLKRNPFNPIMHALTFAGKRLQLFMGASTRRNEHT